MPSTEARTLFWSAVPTAAVGALAAVLGGVLAGGRGVLGAVLGTVLVLAFFGSGLYGLARIGRRWPELFLAAGLLVYMTQVLILLVLLRAFRDATFMDGRAFGLTAVACVIVWLGAQAWIQVKSKTPYVVPAESDRSADAERRR